MSRTELPLQRIETRSYKGYVIFCTNDILKKKRKRKTPPLICKTQDEFQPPANSLLSQTSRKRLNDCPIGTIMMLFINSLL